MQPASPHGAETIWHVTVDGEPACTSRRLAPDERLEFPVCGSRNRARVDEYAAWLVGRHPEARVEVTADGCPVRGE
jgi:hypothetical protein